MTPTALGSFLLYVILTGNTMEKSGSFSSVTQEKQQICLVTHFSRNQSDFAAVAIESQQRYANRHGYLHAVFEGHISGANFLDPSQGDVHSLRGGGLYWQKIRAVEEVLGNGIKDDSGRLINCEWAIWLDSDIVFTNETQRFEDIIDTYTAPRSDLTDAKDKAVPIDVILAAEYHVGICSGIFLVRNTSFGRQFLTDVTMLYPMYKDRVLPDQDAVTVAAYKGYLGYFDWAHREMRPEDLKPGYTVATQRAFNSFPRTLEWPESGRWQPCDFVAHVGGLRNAERIQVMTELLATRHACEDEQKTLR